MKRYLTVKQVCELLPVGKTLIYELLADGTIPSTRLGSKILIPEDGLEEVLTAGAKTQPPRPEPTKPGTQPKRGVIPLW